MHGFVSLHIPVGYMIVDRKESTDVDRIENSLLIIIYVIFTKVLPEYC